MENLKLPLCPKCGDTKYISGTVICTNPPWYICERCSIEWTAGGSGTIREIDLSYRTTLGEPS